MGENVWDFRKRLTLLLASAVIIAVVFFIFKVLFYYVWPFLLAFCFAVLLQKPIVGLAKLLREKKMLMLSNANLLILDEPTNHLDIVSKEILENALNSYTGTILYVSHDRYFINATATRIIELTNRNIVNYIGNYDYYLEKRDILTAKASPDAQLSSSDNTTKKDSKLSWQQSREEQNKLKKKQNEIKKTEIRIAEIEDRLSAIDTEYSDPSIGSNTARLMELHNESTQLKKELDELYEHWEELMDEM